MMSSAGPHCISAPIYNTADLHTFRRAAPKEIIKFATTVSVVPLTRPSTASSCSSSNPSEDHVFGKMVPHAVRSYVPTGNGRRWLNDPRFKFQQIHGRRYTHDAIYPLPCDLPELHRQNLRTLLACTTLGRPICSPRAVDAPPSRVLELGCGTGYWSAYCHQAYSERGVDNIQFIGMDIVSIAPDLRKQGLNWTFVQHDMRSAPWPLDDESFDLVMWKDLSLVLQMGEQSQRVLDECIRVLRPGGILEIWEHDNVVRCIQSDRARATRDSFEERMAAETATIPIVPGTPFAPTQNKYLAAANKWIDAALSKRGLISAPCGRMATMLLQEPESLADVGFSRVAIPLDGHCVSMSQGSSKLNEDQLALRQTALLTIVQMIESLEPLLKEASGRNAEEWSYWWTSMMKNLNSSDGHPLNGETLEMGAWWATKLDNGL